MGLGVAGRDARPALLAGRRRVSRPHNVSARRSLHCGPLRVLTTTTEEAPSTTLSSSSIFPKVLKARQLQQLDDKGLQERHEAIKQLEEKLQASTADAHAQGAQQEVQPGAQQGGGFLGSWWAGMAANDKLVVACTLALMLSNMGKVDMSVAIVPMSAEMGWSASVSGLVQALFYTGYMLACIPGGYLASRTGGRTVLPIALGTWSLATFVAPLAAATVPTLSATRFLVGAGQGVAPSAVVDVVARTVPQSQRASAVTTTFGGLHLGTVVGLLAAPPIVSAFGWKALFYIYGGAGILWYSWFEGYLVPVLVRQDPQLAAGLTGLVGASAAPPAPAGQEAAKQTVPYRAFFRAKEMQALMATHFCNNLYYFTLLSWLPTYFVQDLGMDLSQASFMAMVPALSGFFVSNIAGRFADGLLARGMPLPTVRKTVQSISMLGSAASMLGALAADEPSWVVGLMILGLTAHPFTLAGLFCTPNDLSSKYAGALLGISNTCGALGAVTGIAACGLLLDATGSWELSLYWPLIGTLLAGIYAYVAHCNNEPIDFDSRDNSRFAFEDKLRATLGLSASG